MISSIDEQIQEVIKLRDEDTLTFQEIGDRLGFSERTARRRYQAAILINTIEGVTLEDFPKIEELPVKVTSDFIPEDKKDIERLKPLTIIGDAIVAADWHIPLHDPEIVNALINCAKKEKINQLIIPGDYFHMETFGSYLPHQPEASFEQERHDGQLIMATLLRTFDKIYIGWGNHDYRLTKALGYKHSFTECMKWMLEGIDMDKIKFTDLDYMHYYAKEVRIGKSERYFRICHPQNYSSIPLSVPRKLAMKYDCGVISAHSHHCSIGVAPNGVDIIIEPGGLFSKRRTEYVQRSTANHEWAPGFVYFKDGTPTIVSPTMGNLERYRG